MLLLISEVQTKWWEAVVFVPPSTVAILSPPAEVTSRGFKGLGSFSLPFYFSLSPIFGARHQRLKYSKATVYMGENQKVAARAQDQKTPENILNSQLCLVLNRGS